MITKHIIIAALLQHNNAWKTMWEAFNNSMGATLDTEVLNLLIDEGVVEYRVKHYPRGNGQDTFYRLTEGSKYRMLVP